MLLLLLLNLSNAVVDYSEPAEFADMNAPDIHYYDQNFTNVKRHNGWSSVDAQPQSAFKHSTFRISVFDGKTAPTFSDRTAGKTTRVKYPKIAHAYTVDIQTKIILLGIMMLLFALVFTTTTKMLQEMLKIKMKSKESAEVEKV